MTDKHIEFVGSIPATYDEHLGPLLFEHYAADLAGRVTVPPGGRVLELACGTGIATQRLRAALPGDVEIVATDLNEAMLDFAQDKHGDLPNVDYQVADALDPIKALLQDAGFGPIDFGVLPTVVERPSAQSVALGCVEGNPGIHEIHARATAPAEEIVEAVAAALRENFGDAPLRTPLQAIVVTARKPEEP